MQAILYIIAGAIGGIVSGFFGIGGGIVVIPILIYWFGLSQHQAQGTTLAMMVPPIGLLAAWRYYSGGNVKVGMALFMCVGFFIGGYIGASLVHNISDQVLRKTFGILMFAVSVRMIFFK